MRFLALVRVCLVGVMVIAGLIVYGYYLDLLLPHHQRMVQVGTR